MMLSPPTHQYFGSFGIATGPSASAAGGIALAIHKQSSERATQHFVTDHSRARAMTLSLHASGWVHITAIHVELALPFAAKRRLLGQVADWHAARGGTTFMLGYWNFLARDECRMAGYCSDFRATDTMSTYFDHRFPALIELMQGNFEFRRLGRDSTSPSFSFLADRSHFCCGAPQGHGRCHYHCHGSEGHRAEVGAKRPPG